MSGDGDWGSYIRLPAPPSGWFDYQYAVLTDGTLAIIRTDIDVRAEYALWSELVQRDNGVRLRADLWCRTARIYTFDGVHEVGHVEIPLGFSPVVSRFPDGRWLVAASRSAEGEWNARTHQPSGEQIAAFSLGDGIAQMLCAPDGTIWVGYMDEGIFSGPNADGSWPVSSSGIARFDENGTVLWTYSSDQNQFMLIDDLYALTLDGNKAWSCFYSEFPITSVVEGKARLWKNSVDGAHALAIAGEYALLAGGYNDQAGRVVLLKLGDIDAECLGEIQISDSSRDAIILMQGQGDTLHIVGQGVWRRFDVGEVRRALGF